MKVLFTSLLIFVSVLMTAQETFKLNIPKKTVTSSFVYGISSDDIGDYQLKVVSVKKRSKPLITETVKKLVTGEIYLKVDLSALPKGKYFFIISKGGSESKHKITKD